MRDVTPVRYEVRLAEPISALGRAAFPELTAAAHAGETVLFGAVRDQAHLHGLLARFQTFGLTVVELRRLPD